MALGGSGWRAQLWRRGPAAQSPVGGWRYLGALEAHSRYPWGTRGACRLRSGTSSSHWDTPVTLVARPALEARSCRSEPSGGLEVDTRGACRLRSGTSSSHWDTPVTLASLKVAAPQSCGSSTPAESRLAPGPNPNLSLHPSPNPSQAKSGLPERTAYARCHVRRAGRAVFVDRALSATTNPKPQP